jgi:hypothetical protein
MFSQYVHIFSYYDDVGMTYDRALYVLASYGGNIVSTSTDPPMDNLQTHCQEAWKAVMYVMTHPTARTVGASIQVLNIILEHDDPPPSRFRLVEPAARRLGFILDNMNDLDRTRYGCAVLETVTSLVKCHGQQPWVSFMACDIPPSFLKKYQGPSQSKWRVCADSNVYPSYVKDTAFVCLLKEVLQTMTLSEVASLCHVSAGDVKMWSVGMSYPESHSFDFVIQTLQSLFEF